MLRAFAEIMSLVVQDYLLSNLVCKIYPVKKPYWASFLIVYIQQFLAFFSANFVFGKTPIIGSISVILIFLFTGLFLFEGNRIVQILLGLVEYVSFLILDLFLRFFFLASFEELIESLPPLDQRILGRNIATAAVFIILILYDLYIHRKDGKYIKSIMGLGIGLGVVQMVTLNLISSSNLKGMIEGKSIISMFFSMVMIGGYLVVMELFQSIQRQQQKQAKLEQMALERRYQYDYYQKAYTRSEAIRDMRHDMRNQLQAIQYRFHSEEEESRMRAEEMVNQLCEKIR